MENEEFNRSIQPFDASIRRKNRSFNDVQSNLLSSVDRSGNSDVDVNVNVEVDTMPVALSFLCLALAKKELTRQEFELAVEALVEVTNQHKRLSEVNKHRDSKVKLFDNKSARLWGRY
jgi:hypothetical protein